MTGATTSPSVAAEGSVPDKQKAKGKPSAAVLCGGAGISSSRLPIRTATGPSGPANETELDGVGNFGPVALTADRRKRRSETLGIAAHQFQLPSSYQPSRAAAFQQHFVSHLISSLSGGLHQTRLRYWTFELPTLLTSAGPATIYSIRAAAMAFYGILAGDESIQADACRWYAMGLTCQRSLLQKCATDGPMEMPTMEEIFAPIMFSIFEVVTCTVPNGWIHHLSAAGRMLEMRGPENCQDGTIHTLFRTVRLGSVFITVTTEVPSIFASDPWNSVPFSLHPKSILDKLVDILLRLPDCLARRNQMRALRVPNPRESEAIRTELETRVLLLVSRLDGWWQQYEEEAVGEDGEGWLYRQTPSQEHLEASEEGQYSPKAITYRSTSTAAILSLYHAANIIAYRLLSVVSLLSRVYEWRIVSHADYVLSSAGFQSSGGSSGYDVLLMVFPLKVVCLLTENEQQRRCAQEMLEQLGQKRGLDGICRRATPVYVQRYQ
ncbi:hypothetical protein FGG08_001789 [Glutinoglossum americanum]|uniref:Uncharacterized protein n=1 Tax=Glutinoglossum americanum TaxID=1670608 RepID=A0A9P8IAI4_9PEZI|nr:hypothetical protein FGG08_001789 [Glutinoglossum americanum]